MNCSKCGEALRLTESVKCEDCKEEEDKVSAQTEKLTAGKRLVRRGA